MKGYTVRGSNSVIFTVAYHINWGHLIKERWKEFAPIGENSFLLRVDPIGEVFVLQVSKQEVTKLSPFENMAEKHAGVPVHLK